METNQSSNIQITKMNSFICEGSPQRAAFCRAKNEHMEVYYGRRKNKKYRKSQTSWRKGQSDNEWEYLVEIQEEKPIEVIDHGTLQFTEEIKDSGYHIVYSWGSGNSLLEELDIRGH